MFNKLKEIKDLKDKAKVIQTLLADVSVQGSGAWGKVKVSMDGNQRITAIHMDDDLLNPASKDKLEAGLKDAFKDALPQVQKQVMAKMKDSGIDLPGMGAE